MHKSLFIFLLLSISTGLAHALQSSEKCVLPPSPKLQENAKTEQQLKASISMVKDYQIELEKFRNCIDDEKIIIDEENMDEDIIEKSKIYNYQLDSIYNLSIDKEQAIADQLNSQIREFKKTQ